MQSRWRRQIVPIAQVATLVAVAAVIVLADPKSTKPSTSPASTAPASPIVRVPGSSASGVPGSPLVPAGPTGSAGPLQDRLLQFRSPGLVAPLVDLDPGLATRGPRPTLARLFDYQYGNPAVITLPGATKDQWQLSRPNPAAVRGYADEVSVLPGQDLGLHLSGQDQRARIDIFRVGVGDGQHVLAITDVPVFARPRARPRPSDGLISEDWPRSTTVRVPLNWRSGVYLAKLTGNSGGQSYILFIVRAKAAIGLTIVVPMMTYQAYNDYGGSNLYGWYGGPRPRAYAVSFNRPFTQAFGAGLFFRLDFPLIVWLEDHGYTPSYIADIDLARDPGLARGARTMVFSGHGEYWTGGMRDTMDAAARQGTSLGFFGANQAFWQVRLAPDAAGRPARTMVCYKIARLDPLATSTPSAATVRFGEKPVNRPPSSLMGLRYGGIVEGIQPLVIGPGISAFNADLGLQPGQSLPGLIAAEVDEAPPSFSGVLLGATPVTVTEHAGTVIAGAALWISPAGNRVFDAGTFDFSWGLDPRYSAALSGFPARAYSRLTAEILAWLGAAPTH